MVDAPPPPPPPSAEALFRRFVLGQVDALIDAGWTVSRAVCAVARRAHARLDGRSRRVSVATVKRWRRAFKEQGLAGLEPAPSKAAALPSQVLGQALVDFIAKEKGQDPRASVPEVLRRAAEHGLIAAPDAVDRTTAWRAVCRMGLPTRARPSKQEGDTRRFVYPHRMQCVLCDGKHFRAGAKRAKRVALFFLDDATRYGLDVIVATSESAEAFLTGLYHLVCCFGVPDRFYLDGGPGFIAGDTSAVIAELGAALIHGKERYPEGHGKIERFNQTAGAQVLRSLDGTAEVDPDLSSLTLRLRHYLRRYNDTPHEALSGQTPRQRWEADTRALCLPHSEHALRQRFVVREARKVSKDHVIKHGGKIWEAPRGLADRSVEVIRHVLDGDLFVVHQGRLVHLHEVDLAANATDRRGYPGDSLPQPDEGTPTTAATRAYRRDLAPIVGPDGGFTPTED